jgi:hypothetical protein
MFIRCFWQDCNYCGKEREVESLETFRVEAKQPETGILMFPEAAEEHNRVVPAHKGKGCGKAHIQYSVCDFISLD